VLLYLAGGPGQSDLGYTRAYMTELEDDFVFAVWDQRGTGKSYPSLDPAETLTLERAVLDTIELSSYLADRFGQQKIYLMGSSWGTTLGVLAVQQRPDLFHAWIGTGAGPKCRVIHTSDRGKTWKTVATGTKSGIFPVTGSNVSVSSCFASSSRRVSSSWIGGTPSSRWTIRRI